MNHENNNFKLCVYVCVWLGSANGVLPWTGLGL
jgi:hypothetical protein